MEPGGGDRRGFSRIEGAGFLKVGLHIRCSHEPRVRMGDELLQSRRGTGLKRLSPDGGGDGNRTVKLAEQIQLSEVDPILRPGLREVKLW